jgi:hypothetical protein
MAAAPVNVNGFLACLLTAISESNHSAIRSNMRSAEAATLAAKFNRKELAAESGCDRGFYQPD